MKKITSIDFIRRAKKVHKNEYDYSETVFINMSTPVKIKCPKHGIFEKEPYNHLRSKCPKCRGLAKLTTNDFIFKAKIVHKEKYDYSEVNYVSNKKKIKIKCVLHGLFNQTPTNHLSGQGCPKCKRSGGELKISNWLILNNILYIEEHRFSDCKNKKALPFDFYLPNFNICIEYDGRQHFENEDYFGGLDAFKKLKIHDKIKDQYCFQNDIKLIRIPYYDFDNIERILKRELNNDTM